MQPDDSFAGLMARLDAGDNDAAAEVLDRFTHRLIALARLRLDARLRQKVGLHNWKALWSVLALITARKCCHSSPRGPSGFRD
jgi:hypothetical protein